MQGMRVLIVTGLGGASVDIVGYEDMSNPRGELLYRGQVLGQGTGPLSARDLARVLSDVLLQIIGIVDATG